MFTTFERLFRKNASSNLPLAPKPQPHREVPESKWYVVVVREARDKCFKEPREMNTLIMLLRPDVLKPYLPRESAGIKRLNELEAGPEFSWVRPLHDASFAPSPPAPNRWGDEGEKNAFDWPAARSPLSRSILCRKQHFHPGWHGTLDRDLSATVSQTATQENLGVAVSVEKSTTCTVAVPGYPARSRPPKQAGQLSDLPLHLIEFMRMVIDFCEEHKLNECPKPGKLFKMMSTDPKCQNMLPCDRHFNGTCAE